MTAKLYKVDGAPPSNHEIYSQIRVLIIDDNAVDREMIKINLETLGFVMIQEGKSGSEGMFKIENSEKIGKPFHLVVTDWRMPKKDGMVILKFLKSNRSYREIRVIMVTSVNESEMIKNAILEGVDEFILKPINPTTLNEKIEKVLKIKHG